MDEDKGYIEFRSHYPGAHDVMVRLDVDSNIEQLVEGFRAFALAVGYHPDTVSGALDAE